MRVGLNNALVWLVVNGFDVSKCHVIAEPVQRKLGHPRIYLHPNSKSLLEEYPELLEDTALIEWLVVEGAL